MLIIKRFSAVILAAILSLSCLCGCAEEAGGGASSDPTSSAIQEPEKVFSLIYDGGCKFDPFVSTSVYDNQLFPLVFEGLFALDRDGSPEPRLAKSFEIKGNSVTVTLGALYFSDGSPLKAADVVASYGFAKKCKIYENRFKHISSCKADGDDVIVTFTDNPEYNLCLLDIPVVKRVDGKTYGTGEYSFENDEDGDFLIYRGKESGHTEKIGLYPYKNVTSPVYAFNKKSVCAVALDNSKNDTDFKGNYEIASYATDYFIFIGFNVKNTFFANAKVRKAFNLFLDRAALEEGENGEFAEFVWQPVNPAFGRLSGFDLPSSVYMPDLADELLAESGVKKKNGKYQTAALTLIVNSDDAFKHSLADGFAAQLKRHGIEIKVKTLEYADYLSALAAGEFDLYLAETLMPQNMDVGILSSSTVNFGGAPSSSLSAIYKALASESYSSPAFDEFLEESPLVPICYRKHCLVYTRDFASSPTPSRYNVYSGLFD